MAGLSPRFSRACPLQVIDTTGRPTPTEPVVLMFATSATGWGETDLDAALAQDGASVSYDPEADIDRPVVTGAAIGAPGAGQLGSVGPPQPRKVVFGSTHSFTDSWLARSDQRGDTEGQEPARGEYRTVRPNLQLLRNSVNWLVRERARPEITPRIIQREVTPLPRRRLIRLVVAFLGLLPLGVVVLGITVWRLRRR
jgi:hypothetical protein